MHVTPRNIVAGFVAGAFAVIIFHQGVYSLMSNWGMVSGQPWRMTPNPYGVPDLVNQSFWGGLWGILFALIIDRMPPIPNWVNGLLFGLIFPMLLGSWILVSLIKGRPLFSGYFADFNLGRLRNGFVLNGVAFGIGLGIIYGLLPSRGGNDFYKGPPASSPAYFSGYISLAVGLGLLYAALSGLVLRGTHSSPLLALVGLAAMAFGIYQLARAGRR